MREKKITNYACYSINLAKCDPPKTCRSGWTASSRFANVNTHFLSNGKIYNLRMSTNAFEFWLFHTFSNYESPFIWWGSFFFLHDKFLLIHVLLADLLLCNHNFHVAGGDLSKELKWILKNSISRIIDFSFAKHFVIGFKFFTKLAVPIAKVIQRNTFATNLKKNDKQILEKFFWKVSCKTT